MAIGSLNFGGIFNIVFFNITACCAFCALAYRDADCAVTTRRLLPLNSGSFVRGLRVHGH